MQIAEKLNGNPLLTGMYQKALREYREARKTVKEKAQLSSHQLARSERKRKDARTNLRDKKRELAQTYFNGCEHAVTMQDLKTENDEMRALLESVTSTEIVKVQGKKMELRYFADRQAFGLAVCSSKAVYKYTPKNEKFDFKHTQRCGRRTCSVCAHFDAIEQEKLLMEELTQKLYELPGEKRKNGRIYHIVLTVQNVPLDNVFDIQNAWRHIQKMKIKKYKNAENDYRIWNILEWGIVRWEVTRNEETGLYHPHLHILTFIDGWLAPEKDGYWAQLEHTWEMACANCGLHAEWDGQKFIPVLFFSNSSDDVRALKYNFGPLELKAVLDGSVAEMAKYPMKSTDFTKIERVKEGQNLGDIANEVAKLFALMAGRRLLNGFGGFKLREPNVPAWKSDHNYRVGTQVKANGSIYECVEAGKSAAQGTGPSGRGNEIIDGTAKWKFVSVCDDISENNNKNENVDDNVNEESYEVIFTWDRKQKRYLLYQFREWDENRFLNYLEDLGDFRNRQSVYMLYGSDS